MAEREDSFFIGWAKAPGDLRDFAIGIGVGLVILLGVFGYVLAATQDDPGDGAFLGRVSATGVIQTMPYPVLHVTDSPDFAAGTALLLHGLGKRGAQDRADPFDGQVVEILGARISRGDIDGVQLGGGEDDLKPASGSGSMPEAEDLGRWRITGEICDGKCQSGAMRPGRGLSHKACANLCLIEGVAPVFVATGGVAGAEFFLLADEDGGPVTDALLDHTALLVEIEGQVIRRGGLTQFHIDPASIRKLQ